MRKVQVNASKSYSVLIGEGILNDLPKFLEQLKIKGKILILSDKNVYSIYGNAVKNLLENAFYKCEKFVVKGGESSKSAKDYISVLEFLASNEFTREDAILALGGGVVGDLAGFVSATYLRGVKFIQVPTTLLSAVDSSVGGKTAINLKSGKILAGAFYQPCLVVCDTLVLNTLSEKEFSSGMAEVIKYGCIFDKGLLELLLDGMEKHVEEVIERCVTLKRNVVEKDEFDNGDRQLLNFGHTLGHAIEKQSNFKISHGQAVAIGMKIITEKCVEKGLCEVEVFENLIALIEKYNLNLELDIKLEKLISTTLVDKKRKGNDITVVLPKEIGKCILKKYSINEWKQFILN